MRSRARSEAGIGKSRLAEALTEKIAGAPHIRLSYQCSPYHTNSALYPFIHHWKETQISAAATAQATIGQAGSAPRPIHRARRRDAPLFAALLSLPTPGRYPPLQMAPEQQKARTIDALLDRLGGLAARAQCCSFSRMCTGSIPPRWSCSTWGRAASAHTGACHPYLQGMRPTILLGREHVTRSSSSGSIAAVGDDGGQSAERQKSSGRAAIQIVDRTDGVPLFIEEVAKTLTASVSEVPATLQDSLMARMDHLGSAKEVAQTAAVIGVNFREHAAGDLAAGRA